MEKILSALHSKQLNELCILNEKYDSKSIIDSVENVESLNSLELKNVNKVPFLPNLVKLDISGFNINMDNLKHYTRLNNLSINDYCICKTFDDSLFNSLTSIKILNIDYNNCQNLDLGFLQYMTLLTNLFINIPHLINIKKLEHCKQLEDLYIKTTHFSSTNFLEQCTKLKNIQLHSTDEPENIPTLSVSPLNDFKNIRSFICNQPISDVSVIRNWTSLNEIIIVADDDLDINDCVLDNLDTVVIKSKGKTINGLFKSSRLNQLTINNAVINNLDLSMYPNLSSCIIENCQLSNNVNFVSDSLNVLKIDNCKGLINIDFSKLTSIENFTAIETDLITDYEPIFRNKNIEIKFDNNSDITFKIIR